MVLVASVYFFPLFGYSITVGKKSEIGVDGHDVLLIEDAHSVSSPHPHALHLQYAFAQHTLSFTFQEVIFSVNFS